MDAYLVDAEGAFFATAAVPTGARLLRLDLVGIDADTGPAAPYVTLRASRIGRRAAEVAITGMNGSSPKTRLFTGRPISARLGVVRADTAYQLVLNVPRAADGGLFATQMVRVLYRPRLN